MGATFFAPEAAPESLKILYFSRDYTGLYIFYRVFSRNLSQSFTMFNMLIIVVYYI